jgi:hypothetical protein
VGGYGALPFDDTEVGVNVAVTPVGRLLIQKKTVCEPEVPLTGVIV